jgi:hypothetical protein
MHAIQRAESTGLLGSVVESVLPRQLKKFWINKNIKLKK